MARKHYTAPITLLLAADNISMPVGGGSNDKSDVQWAKRHNAVYIEEDESVWETGWDDWGE